jgi:hypothetical protein
MVDPEERERRLLMLAEALLDGRSHRELVESGVQTWGVSRRTAQAYVQEVQERLRAEAQHLPPLFALALSQLQRNRFLCELTERARRGVELSPRDYCTLVSTANKLLDSRDRSAVHTLKHQVRQNGASEDATLNDLNSQIRELAERDEAFQQMPETHGQPEARSPEASPRPMPIPPQPPKLHEQMAYVAELDDEEVDDLPLDEVGDVSMSLFTEAEKEEMRRTDAEMEEIMRDPVRRAKLEREVQELIAGTTRVTAADERRTAPWPGAKSAESPASPPPAPRTDPRRNAVTYKDLRAERKQRRQERKRLRRLRKRRRG